VVGGDVETAAVTIPQNWLCSDYGFASCEPSICDSRVVECPVSVEGDYGFACSPWAALKAILYIKHAILRSHWTIKQDLLAVGYVRGRTISEALKLFSRVSLSEF
jgi:hypothetical protein